MTLGVINHLNSVIWDSKAKSMKQRPCKSKTGSGLESMNSLLSFIHLVPIIILLAFLIQQTHLLISLLILEGIILRLVFIVPTILVWNSINIGLICILLLTIGACEAAMGLALLVLLSRATGTDIIASISINKC